VFTLENWNPTLRTVYISALVILWIGATLANVATIFGLSVDMVGLVGISVFIGIELVRGVSVKPGRS